MGIGLNKKRYIKQLTLSPPDNQRLADMCGQFDEHLRRIESHLGVEINSRGHNFQIIGPRDSTEQAFNILKQLYKEAETKNAITQEKIHLLLQEITSGQQITQPEKDLVNITIQTQCSSIKPRSRNQHRYLKRIINNDVNFGIGPAGTGKTYLAVACALAAL